MRNLVLAALFLVPLAVSRPAHANADLDAGPLHIDFKVDGTDKKAPVATGSMEMEAQEMTRFESQTAGDASKLTLEFFSRIHHDGTVGVWANYEEVGPKGEKMKWSPSLQGKRGTPLVATIHAGQFERTITITVK